ncbi:uncharacterized protein METZ01_LOCUS401905 [marine metagenome]|uniref:Uncharacterized protein n=1 Tax=marine metagenome TaxID=408172 RepID=A0A382VSY9_9ZZZZ
MEKRVSRRKARKNGVDSAILMLFKNSSHLLLNAFHRRHRDKYTFPLAKVQPQAQHLQPYNLLPNCKVGHTPFP